MSDKIIAEIDNAVKAHVGWKMKLRTAISTGSSDQSPSEVACDNKCAFGKWLYSNDIDAQTKAGMPYSVVKRLHAEFHKIAANVLTEAMSGNSVKSKQIFDTDYTEKSNRLVTALTKWKREMMIEKG